MDVTMEAVSPALSAASSPSPINSPTSTTSYDGAAATSASSTSSFPPPGAPSSHLFEVRETPWAGRGVFATQDIAPGTHLWTAEAPSADVILREYRRELCGWCFAYDRGREWKLRDNGVGYAFCGGECHDLWCRHQGEDGMAAWREVEKLCKGRPREQEMVDADAPVPTVEEIDAAWEVASRTAALILTARKSKTANKPSKRALASILKSPATPDTLSFLLSGILLRAHRPSSYAALNALASNPTPYKSTIDLTQHVTSYLQLVATVPEALVAATTPSTCRTLAARDSHNSFGLRSLDDPDGAEFFGFGVWSDASYWNHACAPNVGKRRAGRGWRFWADGAVGAGQELRISYLGGEGGKMEVGERRDTLRRNWGFECACEACRP
ncbi:hypothetical protein IWX90DRAFT_486229 [Phyllosticta citrichinensis]|uniref:SET domain-containing protein n=1 Tax=Phyllosticta citrichinensis TaxID=1130410 RepID=A0ABR1XSQ6_9PEZI